MNAQRQWGLRQVHENKRMYMDAYVTLTEPKTELNRVFSLFYFSYFSFTTTSASPPINTTNTLKSNYFTVHTNDIFSAVV